MKDFEKSLYEAVLVAFGKILAKYNGFAQASILRDVGREIIDYMNAHGFGFEETGTADDMGRLTELFVKSGFASSLEAQPASPGTNYVWRDLYGIEAYHTLHEISDNPFLACPLNLSLYYLAEKHGKTMRLVSKSFDVAHRTAESQYVVEDKVALAPGDMDPLVIENARLYELAEERLAKLEKANRELKRLRGIIPICAYCKQVRNDGGYWQQVEAYVSEHSDAAFSHGICPDCMEKRYPEEAPAS